MTILKLSKRELLTKFAMSKPNASLKNCYSHGNIFYLYFDNIHCQEYSIDNIINEVRQGLARKNITLEVTQ